MTFFFDPFLNYLERHLDLLDVELSRLLNEVDRRPGADNSGTYDAAEYVIGAGFTAVQKYMAETALWMGHKKDKYFISTWLNIGPKLENRCYFANSVWCAANYWKHDAEWWESGVSFVPMDTGGGTALCLSWPENKNADTLKEFGLFGRDYLCSNVLASLIAHSEGDLKLKLILPYLRKWRDELKKAKPSERQS